MGEEGPEPQELLEDVEKRKEEAEEGGHGEGSPRLVAHRMRCAMAASVLAVAAAVGSLLSGHAANEAILKQSEATDQWAYYQSVSTKGHMYETGKTIVEALAPADGPGAKRVEAAEKEMDKSMKKYEQKKDEIQKEAKGLGDESTAKFVEHQKFSYGVACFQIGIVLASVSILVAVEWLFHCSMAMGAIGVIFTILAVLRM